MTAPPRTIPWTDAESRWIGGEPVEMSAAGLTDRQAWLLRAIDALHDGRPEQVEAVAAAASAAEQHDVAAVLRVVASPQEDLRGTRPEDLLGRRDRQGELDTAELLRLLIAWRRGGNPRGSRAMRTLRLKRPALNAVLELVARTAGEIHFDPRLRALSPRAEAVFMAARGKVLGWPRLQEMLDKNLANHGLTLSAARYPDLEQGELPRPLVDWARGKKEWGDEQDWSVNGLLRRRLPDERVHVLVLLVGAIHRRLSKEGAGAIYLAARAAARIADTLPGLPGLATQLEVLGARAHRLAHDHAELELLGALWASARGRPVEERCVVARAIQAIELQEEQAGVEVPEALTREVNRFLVAHGAREERLGAVNLLDEALSRPELEQLVAALPTADREEALARHALNQDQILAALKSVRALLADPAGAERGAPLLQEVLDLWPERVGAPLKDALEAAFEAVAKADLSLESLAALWVAQHHSPARGLRAQKHLLEVGRRARERPVPPNSPAVGELVFLDLVLGDTAAASERVRALGRHLRAARDPDAADDLALAVLGRIQHASSVVDEARVKTTLAPLTAYLARQPGRAEAVLRRLRDPESMAATGAIQWALENREALGLHAMNLPWANDLLDMVRRLVGDPELFADFLDEDSIPY